MTLTPVVNNVLEPMVITEEIVAQTPYSDFDRMLFWQLLEDMIGSSLSYSTNNGQELIIGNLFLTPGSADYGRRTYRIPSNNSQNAARLINAANDVADAMARYYDKVKLPTNPPATLIGNDRMLGSLKNLWGYYEHCSMPAIYNAVEPLPLTGFAVVNSGSNVDSFSISVRKEVVLDQYDYAPLLVLTDGVDTISILRDTLNRIGVSYAGTTLNSAAIWYDQPVKVTDDGFLDIVIKISQTSVILMLNGTTIQTVTASYSFATTLTATLYGEFCKFSFGPVGNDLLSRDRIVKATDGAILYADVAGPVDHVYLKRGSSLIDFTPEDMELVGFKNESLVNLTMAEEITLVGLLDIFNELSSLYQYLIKGEDAILRSSGYFTNTQFVTAQNISSRTLDLYETIQELETHI